MDLIIVTSKPVNNFSFLTDVNYNHYAILVAKKQELEILKNEDRTVKFWIRNYYCALLKGKCIWDEGEGKQARNNLVLSFF